MTRFTRRSAATSRFVPLFAGVLLGACATPSPPKALPPPAATLVVTLDHRNLTVDLSKVPHEGTSVPLLAIWTTAFPGEAAGPLSFDLLGSDGFRPRSRSECKGLLTSEQANRAYVDLATHDVTFPNTKAPAACYNVRGLVELDGVR